MTDKNEPTTDELADAEPTEEEIAAGRLAAAEDDLRTRARLAAGYINAPIALKLAALEYVAALCAVRGAVLDPADPSAYAELRTAIEDL
jgi:hypothetical protein